MKKKANLLPEEVLKMVIAVICIIFLVFLLVSLYFSLTGEQKKKEAEASMKSDQGGLAKEIQRINDGGTPKEQGHPVLNPSGWYILSFVGNVKKPNLCTEKNCVCICRRIYLDVLDRQIKECDSKGSCAVVSNLNWFDKIKIENGGTWISIIKINGNIDIKKKWI